MKRAILFAVALTACVPRIGSDSLTAFYVSQRVTRSMLECYYNRMGRIYTRTMQLTQVCPNSIQVGRGTQ
jgi:hypothetical protein